MNIDTWFTFGLERSAVLRKSFWYPTLSKRLEWMKRLHTLYACEQKMQAAKRGYDGFVFEVVGD